MTIDAFRGFTAYSEIHGVSQALKILSNERLALQNLHDSANNHNVPCDFHPTTTFDICMTPHFAAYEAESLETYRRAGGDVSHVKCDTEPEEAQARTKVPGAVAAYEWPAASSHPAKLAQFLLRCVVGGGVRLFTFCPVGRNSSEFVEFDEFGGVSLGCIYIPGHRVDGEGHKLHECLCSSAITLSGVIHHAEPRTGTLPNPHLIFRGDEYPQKYPFAPLQPPPFLLTHPAPTRRYLDTRRIPLQSHAQPGDNRWSNQYR